MKFISSISILLLTLAAFASTGPKQEKQNDDQTSKATQSMQKATASREHHQPVPATVNNAGEYAENIYDAAYAKNWKTADTKLAALKRTVRELPQQAENPSQNAEIASSLKNLEHSIPAKERVTTMKESNQITRLATELSAGYRRPTPIGISLLDYQGRQLQIAAETNDASAMKSAAQAIQQEWNRLSSQVEHRSPREATRFGELVRKLQSATNTSEYAQLAKSELDQVDNLERVFLQPMAMQAKK